MHELKEAPSCLPLGVQGQLSAAEKKNPTPGLLGMIIKVKESQAKKPKIEDANNTVKTPQVDSKDHSLEVVKTPNDDNTDHFSVVAKTALVSYSDTDDDSEDV